MAPFVIVWVLEQLDGPVAAASADVVMGLVFSFSVVVVFEFVVGAVDGEEGRGAMVVFVFVLLMMNVGYVVVFRTRESEKDNGAEENQNLSM